LDTITEDPPFVPMVNLPGTSLWHITRQFHPDDLLDYMVVVNDPMTPLANDPNLLARIQRYWMSDPYNPIRISSRQMNVSVLRMADARPFPDWSKFANVPKGNIDEHTISSTQLGFKDRKLWIYTPSEYADTQREYPLLIFMDGEWASGPMQLAAITDTLIKHGRMEPVVIAMVGSGDQSNRAKTLVSNDRHYLFLLTELLPFVQTRYRIDATNLGVGGVSEGAIAAAHAAIKNPAVFSHLLMISPPLGKGSGEDKLREYTRRFESTNVLPKRIFQSVGRYEMPSRFRIPAYILRTVLNKRSQQTEYQFVETGSGHGLVGFRSVLPEALAWVFPAEAPAE
jgi:enterochelin esterase-like enzyme